MKLASLKESNRHKNSMIIKTEWEFDVSKIRNNTFYLNKMLSFKIRNKLCSLCSIDYVAMESNQTQIFLFPQPVFY